MKKMEKGEQNKDQLIKKMKIILGNCNLHQAKPKWSSSKKKLMNQTGG